MMKLIFLFYFISSGFAYDDKISGEIWWTKSEKGNGEMRTGEIVVLAYSINTGKRELIASTKILKPSFPQLFLIGPKQMKSPGTQFAGPFEIEIEYFEQGKTFSGIGLQEKVLTGSRKNIFYLNPKELQP